MALTSTPYGAQPISSQDGNAATRIQRIPSGIANQLGSNIFKWQPVTLNAATGTIIPITNPGGTPQKIFGFFMGVEFTPLGGRPTVSPFWPSGTNVDPTYDFLVYVWPAWLPSMRVQIQADGSVPQTLLGSQFNFTNLAAGSTTNGLSQCTVGAAGIGSGSQGQLTLVEFATSVAVGGGGQSAPGDAYTDLICTIAYPQVGLGFQTSIG